MAEKKKDEPGEDDKCVHPLMCAEDWKDPEGATVLAEYHKDDPSEAERRIEEDLDAFEGYWQKKHGINFQGEYHKEGAPYMESPSGWEGHRPRTLHDHGAPGAAPAPSPRAPPPQTAVAVEKEAEERKFAPKASSIPAKALEEAEGQGPPKEPLRISEVVDINTLEVVSYWIFRIAFGRELHVPIKKEGVADIDVHVNNKDIVVNTNQLYFAFPELVVWHITYTHKGRPILEIGRGVKKGMKVHRINAFRLLMEVWMGSKRAEKESKAAEIKKGALLPQPKAHRAKEDDLREKGDIT